MTAATRGTPVEWWASRRVDRRGALFTINGSLSRGLRAGAGAREAYLPPVRCRQPAKTKTDALALFPCPQNGIPHAFCGSVPEQPPR